MAKVADVRLGWSPSVSTDVVEQVVYFTIDGTTREIVLARDADELLIEVNALSSVQFFVMSKDAEGVAVSSEVYTFVLGDLQPPQPATGLFHQVVAVRDVALPPAD